MNGLMRAARKRKRVAADGERTRYQGVGHLSALFERPFQATWVVPQDFSSLVP